MATPEFLFVYGTLRRGSGHPMQALLARRARWVGPALFRGRLFRVAAYPAVVPSKRPGERVRGDLYALGASGPLLDVLDAYEGCDAAKSAPSEYVRIRLPVRLRRGPCVEAWLYVYNRPLRHLRRLSSGDFLSSRRQGNRADGP